MSERESLISLLDSAVASWPDAPLLTFFEPDPVTLTFMDVHRRSMSVAGALAALGVARGMKVAVVLTNNPLFPLTWLAIARLGAVMVPLNPRFTAEELTFALDDAQVSHAVVEEPVSTHLAAARPGLAGRTLIWSGGNSGVLRGPYSLIDLDDVVAREWPEVQGAETVGIHYTSGTTGFPKGCVLSHTSWLTMARDLMEQLPRVPKRIFSDSPFFYMDALLELCLAMASGAHQFVAPRISLSRFASWLVEFDIDYAEIWEALGSRVLDPDAEAALRARPEPLMFTSFGLAGRERADLQMRFNATIQEMYGMTEVGLVTAMRAGDLDMLSSGSCGLTVTHRQTRIVDPESLTDVLAGETGELWVRGRGVMAGYHDRPVENARCFPGDGWFRTGDLFVRDEQGYHFIVGRLKDMIRRSHENIAAGEVEAAGKTMPGVAQVAVVGVPDPLRNEEVKAFVVLDEGSTVQEVTPELIVTHMANQLAPFKLPRYIEYVSDLPLTASGKVAKTALKSGERVPEPRGFDRAEQVWRD